MVKGYRNKGMESLVSTRAGLTPFVAFHGSFALLTHVTFSFARTRCTGSQNRIRKELTCFILYTFSSFLSILETFLSALLLFVLVLSMDLMFPLLNWRTAKPAAMATVVELVKTVLGQRSLSR